MYSLINLLTERGVELYSTISTLGYSLLPFVFLAIGSLFCNLATPIGVFFSLFIVAWSTISATRFFEHSLQASEQRFLIGYPIMLFYGVFL